ncbi:hypothetical protein [Orenia marismortui]|uniref:Uncharacterized protein n=1 Tax=Orenia marismortui TaxID=46469 RepID=A0A4R8H830_9FIRM|nr:hypothetical protein [Orenia marismortui]TDX51278.1 hypothetical protein C7959_11426 [Orenia marismortui]
MELLRPIKLPKKYELRMRKEINIQIAYLFNSAQEQIPGYLSIMINDYDIDYKEIRFFGVERHGDKVLGKGVSPSHIGNSDDGEFILLFDISELIENKQFTPKTSEGVITLAGEEIGRNKIDINPAIYIG